MSSKIIKNISIDTTFFEEQNFLGGSKLKEIAKLSKEKIVKVHITDITYREILSRFEKNLKTTEEKIKKPKSMLESNARILKNFIQHSVYFNLPDIDVVALYKEFKEQFDRWIKTNKVIVIKTDHLTIADVMNNYFSNNPPFKEGIKKHEFPDAFTLEALTEYFEKKREKSDLISGDKDILSFKSDVLIPTSDSTALIDGLIRAQEEKKKTKTILLIDKLFEKERANLTEDLAETIELYMEGEIKYETRRKNLDLIELRYMEVTGAEIGTFSINYLDEKYANLEAEVSFAVNSEFIAMDHSKSWYDVDMGISHWSDPIYNKIKTEMTVPVSFLVVHKPEKGKNPSIVIDQINDDNDFDIMDFAKDY